MLRHNGVLYIARPSAPHRRTPVPSEPGVGAQLGHLLEPVFHLQRGRRPRQRLLQNLPTAGNNLNGRSFEIAGFCWWQGHKDQDGTDNVYATRYEQNLVNLINALRADFNAPNAPFVVATIGFGGEPLSTKPARLTSRFTTPRWPSAIPPCTRNSPAP